MHLPALLRASADAQRALKNALYILDRLERARLPLLDEVPYRMCIYLAGAYARPALAIDVMHMMQRRQIRPNAVTYGTYQVENNETIL